MKLKLFTLSLLVFFSQQSFAQSSFPLYRDKVTEESGIYVSGNKYQKDILLLIAMMKETHPSIKLGEYKFDIDSLQNLYYDSLSGNADSLLFIKTVREFLCSFNDSHTGLNFKPDQSWIYPISLSADCNRVYISGIQHGYENLLGKGVSSINGTPAEELFSKFSLYLPSDNPFYLKSKINNVLPYYSLWEEEKLAPADSTMLLKTEGGDSVTIKPLRQRQLKVSFANGNILHPIMAPQKELFCYSIVDSLSLCYLQFNSCQDRKTMRNYYRNTGNLSEQIDAQLNKIPAFDEFLKNMFDQIKLRQVRTLVIDARYNTGGNSVLCDILLSWLKPLAELKQFSTYTSESSLFQLNYPGATSASEDSTPSDDDYVYNSSDEKCFHGNVIIFQGERTYSSAGMLVTQIRDNKLGMVVGTESIYSPSSYGDILRWKLPNTGIEGFVSYKKFCRPDSTRLGETSLIPDVRIEQNDLKDNYQCWLIEEIKCPRN